MRVLSEFLQNYDSHSHHVISERKTDITLFLFFHMLYWIIINSLIIYYFERWILQCSDFEICSQLTQKSVCLVTRRLLNVQFCLSCLVYLTILWLISDWMSFMYVSLTDIDLLIFHLIIFVSLSVWCSWHSVQTVFLFFNFSLICTDHSY
jgi:hypothetical protein